MNKTDRLNRIEVKNHLHSSFNDDLAADVFLGLRAPRKNIPSKYFYDRMGSQLFEKICDLPEYYPTRTELSILNSNARSLTNAFLYGDIVELGSGSHRKIRTLLDSVSHRLEKIRYIPFDVSEASLISASDQLLMEYPGLRIFGIVGDFTSHLDAIPQDLPIFIVFLGSTLGNLGRVERQNFLKSIARIMKPGDRFLLGLDMQKSIEILENAYNDQQGLTSEFNKNILQVVNRELRATFDSTHFDHLAYYNEEMERIEMHLRVNRNVSVEICDLNLRINLEKGETIHTENCYKFNRNGAEQMASEAGLKITKWMSDYNKWFSILELALKNA
jgi:L-histidine N-alpha-methyltransferase